MRSLTAITVESEDFGAPGHMGIGVYGLTGTAEDYPDATAAEISDAAHYLAGIFARLAVALYPWLEHEAQRHRCHSLWYPPGSPETAWSSSEVPQRLDGCQMHIGALQPAYTLTTRRSWSSTSRRTGPMSGASGSRIPCGTSPGAYRDRPRTVGASASRLRTRSSPGDGHGDGGQAVARSRSGWGSGRTRRLRVPGGGAAKLRPPGGRRWATRPDPQAPRVAGHRGTPHRTITHTWYGQ